MEQDRKEALIQNLQDAGCNQNLIKEFFDLLEKLVDSSLKILGLAILQ